MWYRDIDKKWWILTSEMGIWDSNPRLIHVLGYWTVIWNEDNGILHFTSQGQVVMIICLTLRNRAHRCRLSSPRPSLQTSQSGPEVLVARSRTISPHWVLYSNERSSVDSCVSQRVKAKTETKEFSKQWRTKHARKHRITDRQLAILILARL